MTRRSGRSAVEPNSANGVKGAAPLRQARDPRSAVIGMVYRLHGSLRTLFAGPHARFGLVLLEALSLSVVCEAEEAPTVSEVGRILGYSRQSVQRAMNKLVEMDLVRAVDNPRHKRAPIFAATPAGISLSAQVRKKADALAEGLAEHFSDAEAEVLFREMERLLGCIKALTPQGR
ncbi:MarR family winged helix-turn-helix transcriptional regulator [Novosphingobium sp. M1R2S20]|uniref:MarR family winged helix-turn-helix transcriptional regulator n=1 Tax=Novosphingobium rhizovicinum TaxID=3228928 RepID=A0ABV3REL3_9SPHN